VESHGALRHLRRKRRLLRSRSRRPPSRR
jgi:hypothetical protein